MKWKVFQKAYGILLYPPLLNIMVDSSSNPEIVRREIDGLWNDILDEHAEQCVLGQRLYRDMMQPQALFGPTIRKRRYHNNDLCE